MGDHEDHGNENQPAASPAGARSGNGCRTIELATRMGVPLSTTHTISTAIMGVCAVRRSSAVHLECGRATTECLDPDLSRVSPDQLVRRQVVPVPLLTESSQVPPEDTPQLASLVDLTASARTQTSRSGHTSISHRGSAPCRSAKGASCAR